jgi:hypothetical protein
VVGLAVVELDVGLAVGTYLMYLTCSRWVGGYLTNRVVPILPTHW